MTAAPPGPLLVPLDGSELADRILPHVETLLAGERRDVLLLRVLQPVPFAGAADPERAAAEAHLAQVQARLERTGARVATSIREGDPAEEVLRAVAELAPALVAMSTHGRSGLLRRLRGDVAERVLRGCASPLLLVSPRPGSVTPWRFERILVPLDASDRALEILPLVAELGRRHGAEALLLHAEPLGPRRGAPGGADAQLRTARERLAAAGIPARVVETRGDAAAGVLDVAEREAVDLIAMTTRGPSRTDRPLVGSVCEQVLASTRRPLLALHVA